MQREVQHPELCSAPYPECMRNWSCGAVHELTSWRAALLLGGWGRHAKYLGYVSMHVL